MSLNSLGSVGTLVLIYRRNDRTLIPDFGNNVAGNWNRSMLLGKVAFGVAQCDQALEHTLVGLSGEHISRRVIFVRWQLHVVSGICLVAYSGRLALALRPPNHIYTFTAIPLISLIHLGMRWRALSFVKFVPTI